MAEKGYLFGVGLKMVADDYYVCSGSEGVLHLPGCADTAAHYQRYADGVAHLLNGLDGTGLSAPLPASRYTL